jgi:kynureninase
MLALKLAVRNVWRWVGMVHSRADASEMDAADELARFRDQFHRPEPGLVYLDGNSLGMLPAAAVARAHEVIVAQWGQRLIRSWDEGWLDLPGQVGDRLGTALLGAAPGQVLVSDSTTVNLYKLAAAALDARADRSVIVTSAGEFPTDRYVLAGLAAARGLELRQVAGGPEPLTAAALESHVDDDTAVVVLSHVDYRSAAIADLAGITALAHRHGALMLWDLSHSAGALPVGLDAAGVDLAVGCSYKYLNGGPGAPAYLYVRRAHQGLLRQPIWGWFGQREQFTMGPVYDPEPDVGQFQAGTPPIVGLSIVDVGVALLAEAGVPRLRAKALALGSLLVDLYEEWLVPLGFRLASPRDAAARGSHVALAHPDGRLLRDRLVARAQVVPDFRMPDQLRFGLAPLTTSFTDVWDAMDRLRRLAEPAH